jgi:hypothetical protein
MYSINKLRKEDYKEYHRKMMIMGDCDPAYPALNYLADRFELNMEQRYWIAWLYACCYCVPTVYYIYNEFPDYENVDTRRLDKWWKNNKQKTLFQTDRAKVKNFNKLVDMFESYRSYVSNSQQLCFESIITKDAKESYDKVYNFAEQFHYFGRYSLFLYLESLYNLTNLPIRITGLNLVEAKSSRNGLCYALGVEDLVVHKDEKILSKEDYNFLTEELEKLVYELEIENPKLPITYWNVETSLCAYKKLYWKTRYLGYYIDRLQEEISKMEKLVQEGVDWSVMWDFRKEYFNNKYLGELQGWYGVRNNLMGHYKYNKLNITNSEPEQKYKQKVVFNSIGNIYEL